MGKEKESDEVGGREKKELEGGHEP